MKARQKKVTSTGWRLSIDAIDALKLAEKLRPDVDEGTGATVKLTWAERTLADRALSEYAERHSPPMRRRGRHAEHWDRDFFAVMRYLYDIEQEKIGRWAARQAARLDFGMTETQMTEALRTHRTNAKKISKALLPKDILALSNLVLGRIRK